ncbi:MAG: serine/arginine repetitive matrix protein 2 [Nocardioides sp.]
MATRARLSREEHDAKLEALHQRLTEAVNGLVSGEDWKRALEFAARFRSRSFNNTLLIYVQHYAAFQKGLVPDPMPTYVAGFKQWLSTARNVMRGQSGYQILAPVTARFASPTPEIDDSWRRLGRGEKPSWGEVVRSKLVGLRPAYVFDVSQTDGDPIPETPRPVLLHGQAPEGLWDGLAAQVQAQGFDLRLVASAGEIGGANGLTNYLTHEVSVRVDMDDAAQVKTLAHELGHVMLHGPGNEDAVMHRGVAEVEAESIALMVGAAHGLATDDYTIPYVTSWAASVPGKTPTEVVQSTAERVRGTAVKILDQLDTTMVGDGTPPGLDRDALAREHASGRKPTGVKAGPPAEATHAGSTPSVEAVALR